MARLFTAGAEVDGGNVGANIISPDGQGLTGAVTRDVVTFRSGLASYKFDGAAGAAASLLTPSITVTSSTVYFRFYLRAAAAPTANVMISQFGPTGTGFRLTTGGTLALMVNNSAQGSASAVVTDSAWYRAEWSITCDGSNNITAAELLLDGASIATFSGSVAFGAAAATSRFGWFTNPGAAKILNLDDVAVNDSSGSAQTTWPGPGKVTLLLPTATSAAGTGWVLGNNTAEGGNGWNSVNNTPPVGIADLGGAGADTGQIRNATASANSNFDATMQSYSVGGVTATATLNVVDPVCITAAPVTTSSKQGTVGVVSNPAIANIALAAQGTSGAFWAGSTAGTYTAGWKVSHGTITYAPSVTLGTAPVMRVTQVTSSTRIAMVCFMGIYIDFTPSTYIKAGFGKENA